MQRAAVWEALAVLSLLAVLAVELGHAVQADGLTNDEVLYIPAGYQHLFGSDYRINPTAPPVASTLAAVGLVGLRVHAPEPRPAENELAWSYRFMHVENDAATLMARARAPIVVLTIGLSFFIWLWARAGQGPVAGLLALVFAVFHPSLLAHGHLATTDMPATFLTFLGSWAFWRWCRSPSLGRAALVGAALGLSAATRLTGWLLLPSLVLVAVLEGRRPKSPLRKPRVVAGLAILVLAVALVAIWAAYGFHYAPAPGASVAHEPAERLGVPGAVLASAERLHLLPETYLEGARYQLEHNRGGHPAYLLGLHSKTGWWWYFLVALMVKNTPGFLLAGAAALFLSSRRSREPGSAPFLAHCAIPAAVVLLAQSLLGLQIGERYILPMYPYLIVVCATTLTPWVLRARARWLAVGGLVALHALPAVAVIPHGYLTYFNVIAGGTTGGHRVLLDSNLDWGQDLPRLADWMKAKGVGTVQLAYHGEDDPDRLGIRHEDLPGLHLYEAHPARAPLQGVVVVSPNLLFGLIPRLGDHYAALRDRPPDARAGVFFVFFFPPAVKP